MNRATNELAASITRAKLELDDALEGLKDLPMLDPMVLGFIGHALGSYLHLSSGTIKLLGGALKNHPQPEVGIWLRGLQDATARMGNLVNALQTKPRKSVLHMIVPQFRFEQVDLATLVRRACNFYRRPASLKQIEVHFESSSPPPIKVRTDRVAVAAVLDNLLGNAMKLATSGSRVSVEVTEETGSVVCRIHDEGSQVRTGLLQRGAALSLRTKRQAGDSSTDYGLTMAAELVANLGGEFESEGDRGKNVRFFFRLPRSRTARAARLRKRSK